MCAVWQLILKWTDASQWLLDGEAQIFANQRSSSGESVPRGENESET